MISEREVIEAAIEGLQAQIAEKQKVIESLKAQLTGTPTPTENAPAKKRQMSEAGKKAIRDAQRKRWAAVHSKIDTAPKKKSSPKKKLSPARKAALIANLKKARAARAAKRTAGGKIPF